MSCFLTSLHLAYAKGWSRVVGVHAYAGVQINFILRRSFQAKESIKRIGKARPSNIRLNIVTLSHFTRS